MSAQTFGTLIILLIVIAFFVNYINFQGKTKRQLEQYLLDKESLTERLKKTMRDRENEQALIHTQTYIIKEAEESIRRLEARVSELEDVAQRLEVLSERYRALSRSWPRPGEQ